MASPFPKLYSPTLLKSRHLSRIPHYLIIYHIFSVLNYLVSCIIGPSWAPKTSARQEEKETYQALLPLTHFQGTGIILALLLSSCYSFFLLSPSLSDSLLFLSFPYLFHALSPYLPRWIRTRQHLYRSFQTYRSTWSILSASLAHMGSLLRGDQGREGGGRKEEEEKGGRKKRTREREKEQEKK